jgi:hypothetical protein
MAGKMFRDVASPRQVCAAGMDRLANNPAACGPDHSRISLILPQIPENEWKNILTFKSKKCLLYSIIIHRRNYPSTTGMKIHEGKFFII